MAKQCFFIGDRHKTKYGVEFEIIDYNSSRDITIRFPCGYVRSVQGQSIHSGFIEYPLHKTCAGLGYLGVGRHKATANNMRTTPYGIWYGMMMRCYMYYDTSKNRSYTTSTVCEEWHNYQNFGDWFEENYINGFEIDKDLRVRWASVYSPDTCSFIPKDLNKLMTDHRSDRGLYPIGVGKRGNKYTARCFNGNGVRQWLGSFDAPEDAFNKYKEFKEGVMRDMAKKYKSVIHPEVYDNLMSWEVYPYPENERENDD